MPSPSTPKPSVRANVGGGLQPQQRPAQRGEVGLVHAEGVALRRVDADHRPGDGPLQIWS